MAGRKSKLTEEMTQVICDNIELGLSYNLTCQAAGITFETFNEWMKSGFAGKEKKFCVFFDSVRAAESACAKGCLERIRASAEEGSVSCDMWLLERRYPADYGRKENISMKSQTEALNLNVDITADEIEKRRSALLSRLLKDVETESVEEDSSEPFTL
jgi:transposase